MNSFACCRYGWVNCSWKRGSNGTKRNRRKADLPSRRDMTHLWERRHKKENTESCPRWILPSLLTRFSLRRWHFRLPQLIFFLLRFTLVWKTVPLRHFAFSSQQHQGFLSPFSFFSLRHRQKKLNASKTGVAEGQIETNKRCLEYCVKLNFQFLHHFCLVSIIFLPFLLCSFPPCVFIFHSYRNVWHLSERQVSWMDAFLCKP